MLQSTTVEESLQWLTRVPIRTGMLLLPGVHVSLSHVGIRSQWYITFKETPHLDKKHTVFGKLVGGEDVLNALESLPVKSGTDRPAKTVRITEVVM